MKLHELKAFKNDQKSTKRRGRGGGSGLGTTAGKGHKGQKARAGGGVKPEFEGGQLPLTRRVPKSGFKNLFSKKYNIINLEFIEQKFSDKSEIDLNELYKFCTKNLPIKILGRGEINIAVKIEAHKVSSQAEAKIKQAGGEVRVTEE